MRAVFQDALTSFIASPPGEQTDLKSLQKLVWHSQNDLKMEEERQKKMANLRALRDADRAKTAPAPAKKPAIPT